MKMIAACSGGPDSMALLDQLVQKKYDVVAAHVNYHQRASAKRDENIVREYCAAHDIPCVVLDAYYPGSGNFQAWARDVRYAFFADTAEKYGAEDVYVAHHLDDSLETYLFQKKRGMLCERFGLGEQMNYKGICIRRPLLAYEKKELEQYCIDHGIPYGIDESNLTDHYARNELRHRLIDPMTRAQKKALQQQIEEENRLLEEKRSEGMRRIETEGMAALLEDEEAVFYLDLFLSRKMKRHLSKDHLKSLVVQLGRNCVVDLQDHEVERHDDLVLIEQKTQYPTYLIENEEQLKNFQSFELGKFAYWLNNRGKVIEGVTLTEADFPITLRPACGQDKIRLRFGTKSMHRFWIDSKIPRLCRRQWYVMENAHKTVIFVPGIGCDVSHFSTQPTCFMLQSSI